MSSGRWAVALAAVLAVALGAALWLNSRDAKRLSALDVELASLRSQLSEAQRKREESERQAEAVKARLAAVARENDVKIKEAERDAFVSVDILADDDVGRAWAVFLAGVRDRNAGRRAGAVDR